MEKQLNSSLIFDRWDAMASTGSVASISSHDFTAVHSFFKPFWSSHFISLLASLEFFRIRCGTLGGVLGHRNVGV